MARSLDPKQYGPEYEQLLLRAHEHLRGANAQNQSAEFTVQLDTPALANSLRSKVYAYFAALRSSTYRPDLTSLTGGLALRVAGSALVIFRREDSWDAEALRKGLGLEKGFDEGGASAGVIIPPSGQAAHLEKLKEIRSRKK